LGRWEWSTQRNSGFSESWRACAWVGEESYCHTNSPAATAEISTHPCSLKAQDRSRTHDAVSCGNARLDRVDQLERADVARPQQCDRLSCAEIVQRPAHSGATGACGGGRHRLQTMARVSAITDHKKITSRLNGVAIFCSVHSCHIMVSLLQK